MAKLYGRKIKRSKNLYKKRKSKARRVVEVIVMLVIVAGLVFVGYFCGKPLLDYIKGDVATTTKLEWTPAETTPAPSDTTAPEGSDTTAGTTVPEPEETLAVTARYVPSSALKNETALRASLQNLVKNGSNAAVLELKDSTGHILYKTNVSAVKDTEIVSGTLTLAKIKDAFDDAGIIPIVSLSTLADPLAPKLVDDVAVRFADDSYAWLDARAEKGGKQWADPNRAGTTRYIRALVSELTKAGFAKVMLTNTVFPELTDYDLTILSDNFTNMNNRYKALSALAAAAEKTAASSEGTVMIEADVKEILENYDGFKGSAEILRGAAELSDCPVVAVLDLDEIGSELKTSETDTVTLPSDTASLVANIFRRTKKALDGMTVIPCITAEKLTDTEMNAVKTALVQLGYESYFIK